MISRVPHPNNIKRIYLYDWQRAWCVSCPISMSMSEFCNIFPNLLTAVQIILTQGLEWWAVCQTCLNSIALQSPHFYRLYDFFASLLLDLGALMMTYLNLLDWWHRFIQKCRVFTDTTLALTLQNWESKLKFPLAATRLSKTWSVW